MMTLLRLIVSFFIVISFSTHAEVFKWTDENGKTHFGDKPPADTNTTTVDTKKLNVIKTVKPSLQAKKKTPSYRKDMFRMPVTKSKVPYRFIMTSAIQEKEPVDRLDKININSKQRSFIIFVKLTGTEANKEYNFQARVIDAKGELIFNKSTKHKSDSNSIFFVNKITPNLNIDDPGNWTFQGILNKKTLYVEKKKIKFSPRKIKPSPSTGSTSGLKLADKNTHYSEKEMREHIEKKWGIGRKSSGAAAFLANPKKLSRSDLIDPVEASRLRNLKCPAKKGANCAKQSLKGADYSRLFMLQISFMQANLEGANFSGAEIHSNSTFSGANLKGADFSGAKLNNVAFTDADLTGANFRHVSCNGCTFDEANLTDVVLSGDNLNRVTFRKANMKNFMFEQPMTHWSAFDMTGATNLDVKKSGLADLVNNPKRTGFLLGSKYSVGDCNLGQEETVCNKANLANHRFLPIETKVLDLSGSNLSNADFTGVRTRTLILDGANLSGARLPKMGNIRDISFIKADLSGASFNGGAIKGDFTGANFTNANLSKLDMKRANITNAIFNNTNMSNTKVNLIALTKANIKECSECKKIIESAKIDIPFYKEALANGFKKSDTLYKDKEAYTELLNDISRAGHYTRLLISGEGIIKQSDLIDVMNVMLSSDTPKDILNAFKIIDKYKQVYALEKMEAVPICIAPKLIDAVLPKLTYQGQELEKPLDGRGRKRFNNPIKIREYAINCVIRSDFTNNPVAVEALIDAYQKEEDNKLRRALVYGLTESHADVTLPLLLDAIKNEDLQESDAAARSLATWESLPVVLLPWLVEKTQGNRKIQKGWMKLLESYGGAAKDYLPELYENLAEKVSNKWKDDGLSSAVGKLKIRNKVNDIGELSDYTKQTVMTSFLMPESVINEYTLKYTQQLSHFLPVEIPDSEKSITTKVKNWITDLIKKTKGSSEIVISNPFYTEDVEVVRNLLTRYGLNMKDTQRTEAVAGVEYYTNTLSSYGKNARFGVDVIIARTEGVAKEIAGLIVDKKRSRRIIATKGKVVYILWGDATIDQYIGTLFYQEIRSK
ncbi:MAG: DUF4124 domain-containing protein [Proteobacteria bacterium]|nr:DUF4124 domain-containing protein [Pseudomonadota bacterium]NOG60001.1 DUF4124 domain-containing protein [Pseudomonadota bacterium]